MKLELGCGDRPTEGYLHQDISKVNGTKLDFECQPLDIKLEEGSLEEVIALGVMEHMNEVDFTLTLSKIIWFLQNNGQFLFDVPDMKYWFDYMNCITGMDTRGQSPFDEEHVTNTILGWRRFPGDEHKSFWWYDKLANFLKRNEVYYLNSWPTYTIFWEIKETPEIFVNKGFKRNRFERYTTDRHLYVKVTKVCK